jgi:hypothetical protein
MNLFFIGTPLQLLNATEARHFFGFSDNHLIIALDLHTWPKTGVFARLIQPCEWESVHYITLYNTSKKFSDRFIGKYFSIKLENCFYKYYQYLNKSRLHRIARSFPSVNNLILGNYHGDHARHFPHLVKHDRLYLVDDGTDVLYINEERKKHHSIHAPQAACDRQSAWNRIRSNINESLKWNSRQADNITFFTAYNITVKNGDQVIKNEYNCIRKRIAPALRQGSCLFLGQCLVRDGYLGEAQYLSYLRSVRSYFKDSEVIYVPHPRESKSLVDHVHQHLGFTIRRLGLPIEWQLILDTERPAVLASFFCSALVTCAAIFRREFKLKAFYLQPKDIQKWPEFVEGTYDYFSSQMAPLIEVVRL